MKMKSEIEDIPEQDLDQFGYVKQENFETVTAHIRSLMSHHTTLE